jgi:glycosyltransferase involved in cell wall biosynthesis
VIRAIFSTFYAPFDPARKNVILIYHLDTSFVRRSGFYRSFEKIFFERARLADRIIVVSKYWKNIMEDAGCPRVDVINNAFDLDMFSFAPPELREFREKINVSLETHLIYLGNARPEKGFREAYEALKNIDAEFVVTGGTPAGLPVRSLFLPYREYLMLLKISSIVITMSQFNEGWCRTAHEAMLCGTPVIGSGKGGMRELLEGGHQIICNAFDNLNREVRNLLADHEQRRAIGLSGQDYARNFTLQNFQGSWDRVLSVYCPA